MWFFLRDLVICYVASLSLALAPHVPIVSKPSNGPQAQPHSKNDALQDHPALRDHFQLWSYGWIMVISHTHFSLVYSKVYTITKKNTCLFTYYNSFCYICTFSLYLSIYPSNLSIYLSIFLSFFLYLSLLLHILHIHISISIAIFIYIYWLFWRVARVTKTTFVLVVPVLRQTWGANNGAGLPRGKLCHNMSYQFSITDSINPLRSSTVLGTIAYHSHQPASWKLSQTRSRHHQLQSIMFNPVLSVFKCFLVGSVGRHCQLTIP